MFVKKIITGLTAASALVFVSGLSAQAYNMRLGGVNVTVDTIGSAGISMLTTDADEKFFSASNGGTADQTVGVNLQTGQETCGTQSVPSKEALTYGSFCLYDNTGIGALTDNARGELYNYESSINTDDGRLNYGDAGDLIGGTVKATFDIEADMDNYMAFFRVNTFYDPVLMDGGERGGLSEKGESKAGRDIEVLDAYVSADFDIGNMPLNVRGGWQVINWGEATFIPGGNSSFNPIDVAALRRPGAEIKEALLPVEALYASLGITDSVSVEAYVGGWDEYKLDVGGTAFASSDAFNVGSEGGNENVSFYGGGSRAGLQFVCDSQGLADVGMDYTKTVVDAMSEALYDANANPCNATANVDVLKTWTSGNAEQERLAANGNYRAMVRGSNDDGDEQMGLAVRWYAESLGSTEFGLYYQKGDSRLPYVSWRINQGDVTYNSISPTSSLAGRTGEDIALFRGTNLACDYAALADPRLANVMITDVHGLTEAVGEAIEWEGETAGVGEEISVANMLSLNCEIINSQRDTTLYSGIGVDGLPTGATTFTVGNDIEFFSEFPEVETMGLSFNSTLMGIGLQGDFSFRPEVPLQLDVDVLAIGALFADCTFASMGVEPVYIVNSMYEREFGTAACANQTEKLVSHTTDYDALTWDIGTTTVFAQSSPILQGLGADGGVLVTEFQGLYVDGIEEERGGDMDDGDNATVDQQLVPLTNVCTSGSDLPLGGILGIDPREDGECRPTDNSWGAVVYGRLDYNNVFNTPVTLSPALFVTSGIEGYSPSPIGSWKEGVGSAALSLNASYLGSLQGGISFRYYFGDELYTRNTDRNNISLNVSYAF